MRTLNDIAEVNLKAAGILLKEGDGSTEMLNMVAYHLQQSVELFVKYTMEKDGVRYPKTHDIALLLQLYSKIPKRDVLMSFSDTLTVWKEKAQYDKIYSAPRESIQRVYDTLCDLLLDTGFSWEKWYGSLSVAQRNKLKEINSVVYSACEIGEFISVEVILSYLKLQIEEEVA